MPVATHQYEIARPVAEVFASWCRTSERLRLTPPDLHLELVEGPADATLGARFTWKVRRWGLTQRWVSEIAIFEPPQRIVEIQTQGPFPRWQHTLRFEESGTGTLVVDDIDFDPPSGLLGRWLTAESVQRELQRAWAYRDQVW